MNSTIIRLTAQSLLGRRRVLVLLVLPAILLGLAILIRTLIGTDDTNAAYGLVGVFGLGTLMPLLGLIAGTGAIGPEIDDSSIIYLLAKPLRRSGIIASKLLVAVATVLTFGVLPIFVAGIIASGSVHPIATSFAAAAAVAAIAYCAIFLLLATITRNAVVIGLLYALVWESVVGQFMPGAQALSVQQWALAIAEWVAGDDARSFPMSSAVELRTAIIALVVVSVGCFVLASRQLRRLRLNQDA